jgi:hypothetical protein
VNIDKAIANDYAEDKVESGEWDSYLIPELIEGTEIIYHD